MKVIALNVRYWKRWVSYCFSTVLQTLIGLKERVGYSRQREQDDDGRKLNTILHLSSVLMVLVAKKPTQNRRYKGKQATSFSSHHYNNVEVEWRRALKQWLSYGIKFQHSVYLFDLLLRCGVCFQVESFKMTTFLPYFKASYPDTILPSRREGVDSPFPFFFFFLV